MTAYNADEVARLVRASHTRYAATGTVRTVDALDMADQLEAAARLVFAQDAMLAELRLQRDRAVQERDALRASVVAAMSGAGPEVGEDERTT